MSASQNTPNQSSRQDLVGQQFGNWTVIFPGVYMPGHPTWVCRCRCGVIKLVRENNMVRGTSTNCGCSRVKHRMMGTPEYKAWQSMKKRCHPKDHRHARYFDRGITVSPEWEESFSAFLRDLGPKPSPAHSLDRIDGRGNYEPGNVRWATNQEQARNRRRTRLVTWQGETLSLREASGRVGIAYATVLSRIGMGWSVEDALTRPLTHARTKAGNLNKAPQEKSSAMIPVLGVVSEVDKPVTPTPQFKKWPATGVLLVANSLTSTQQQTLSVAFTDSKGNPARVDGAPIWQVDNPNVLALYPAQDGLSCKIAAVGPLGNARVSIQADADLGAGVETLAGVFDVEVTAGKATEVVVTGGPVEEQTP